MTATATRKTATCKCGAVFELPAGRGRPPVSCLPCRALKFGPVSKTADVIATVTVPCVKCGAPFQREVKRGRPHTACPACRVERNEATVEATPEAVAVEATPEYDATVYTFAVGDYVRLKAGAYATDPEGRDAFVIRGIKVGADGSVKHYDAFGGDPTDPEGIRSLRSFAPAKIRPENRKHIKGHRHHPGSKETGE